MKIAFIIPALANKGPVIVVKDLCLGLIKRGHECKIFYFDTLSEIEMPCECEKIKFWKTIEFKSFDVVHSHCFRPDAYVFIHKRLENSSTKYFSTLHTHIGESLKYYMSPIKRWILVKMWFVIMIKFDKIFVLSDYHKKYYEANKRNYQKVKVIYNGRNIDYNKMIDDDDIATLKVFKENYIAIGLTAIITKRKGIEQIIYALESLPEYGLILIGDGGELVNLLDLADVVGVRNRILNLGSRSEAYRYVPYFDVFAMTSRAEGFPLSLLEAAAFKVPIVCSKIPVFSSVVSEDEVSFFNIDNIDSLVTAIKRAYVNRKKYSDCMYKLYSEKFTGEAMVENYLKFYC